MSVEVVTWKAGSPFSTAIKANGFLFVSGSVPVDPQTGALVAGDIRAQTRRVLQNLTDIVTQAGVPVTNVVRCTVYLTDVADFAAMNEVFKEFFPTNPPTRTTIGVNGLAHADFKIEIDLIAAL